MMQIGDTEARRVFFETVRKGPGIICTLDGTRWNQHSFSSPKDALKLVEEYGDRADVYASMGTVRQGTTNRKKENIESLNGLFLDLDCHGKAGEYVNVKEASKELKTFCSTNDLPKPTQIVQSGHGLHAHWVFQEPLGREDWQTLANKLKTLTDLHGLRADPTVTADPARVLRVPGTLNFREPDNPVPVEMFSIPAKAPLVAHKFAQALDRAITKHSQPQPHTQPIPRNANLAELEAALDHISPDVPRGSGSIIGPDRKPVPDYWFGCLLAARREYGDAAKEAMRRWSKQSDRFTEAGFEHAWGQYDPTHPNPVGIGSLFALAKANGTIGGKPERPLQLIGSPDGMACARFKLLDRKAIMAQPPLRWAVKGVFPERGVGAIYGPSASGKSFLALDLGFAIARGEKWFGHRTSQAPVTYVALEGEAGLRNRVAAWEKQAKAEMPANFLAMAQPFELAEDDQVEALAAILPKRGVTIIDTLNRAAPGLDENSSQDMGRILSGMKRLQEITGGLVLVVHHTGKDASKGLRGHSSLFAALDGAIEVERTATSRAWSAAKVKDGEDGKQNGFRLFPIDLGSDADGDRITSCAVERDTSSLFQRKPPTGAHQRTAIEVIRVEVSSSGDLGKASAGAQVKCISLEDAVTATAAKLVGIDAKRRTSRAREAIQGLIYGGHLQHGLDQEQREWLWLESENSHDR